MRGVAFPVLSLLFVTASSMAAQEPRSTYVQVVEPKLVPGIPDVLFGENPPIDKTSSVKLPPALMIAQNSERKIQSVVEPKIPPGVPQNESPAEAKKEPLKHTTPPVARSGWYAGASLGGGGLDAGYQRTFQTIFSTGATTARVVPEAKDTMGKVYIGYRVSPYMSIESGYWDFGEASYSASISTPVVTDMARHFRARGIGVDDVFWLPSNDSLAVFIRIGAMLTSVKASSSTPGGGLTALPAQSSNTFNLHWGVGSQYAVNSALALRLEYEAVYKVGKDSKFGTADIQLFTAGAAYKF